MSFSSLYYFSAFLNFLLFILPLFNVSIVAKKMFLGPCILSENKLLGKSNFCSTVAVVLMTKAGQSRSQIRQESYLCTFILNISSQLESRSQLKLPRTHVDHLVHTFRERFSNQWFTLNLMKARNPTEKIHLHTYHETSRCI